MLILLTRLDGSVMLLFVCFNRWKAGLCLSIYLVGWLGHVCLLLRVDIYQVDSCVCFFAGLMDGLCLSTFTGG